MSDEFYDTPETLPATVDDTGPVTGIAAEKAQLETEMADTKGHQKDGYWNSERKQARYRELLDLESEPVPDAAEPVHLAEDDVPAVLDNLSAMGEVGAQFADEIRNNAAQVTLETIEQTRVDVLAELGASANEVAMAFDGLGDNVRAAVFAEFGNPYVPRLPEAEAEDVAQFTQEASAGKILSAEWGSETPRKLAGVLYRWDRLTERLSDEEMVELDDFWRHRLQAHERASILRRLAA